MSSTTHGTLNVTMLKLWKWCSNVWWNPFSSSVVDKYKVDEWTAILLFMILLSAKTNMEDRMGQLFSWMLSNRQTSVNRAYLLLIRNPKHCNNKFHTHTAISYLLNPGRRLWSTWNNSLCPPVVPSPNSHCHEGMTFLPPWLLHFQRNTLVGIYYHC